MGRRERGRCIRMRWNIKGQRCAIKNTRARGFEELRGAALISMGKNLILMEEDFRGNLR